MTITQAEIDDLRRKHRESKVHYPGHCYTCLEPWPCPTLAMLADHKAQAERIEKLEGALQRIATTYAGDANAGGYAHWLANIARAVLGETEEG